MSHFHIRRISNGKIKLFGKYWKPKRNGDATHLNKKWMVFADYRLSSPDLLNLWGTPSFYYYDDVDNEIGKLLWIENCKLLGYEEQKTVDILPSIGGFSAGFCDVTDNGIVTYPSRGIEWWEPVNGNT